MGVEDAMEIRRLLGYKDDTAGGMMTTQFVSMSEDDTVQDTIDTLRGLDEDFPSVHYVYVLDEDTEKLVGVLSMRTLVLAQPQTHLKDIMYTDIVTVSPDEDEEEVASDIARYDMVALPVVDEGGYMLGLVTVDDAMDVIEESTEDQKTLDNVGLAILVAMGGIAFLMIYTAVLLKFVGVY